MRRGAIVACVLLAAALAPSRAAGAPPAEVEKTVRQALTEILAEPDPVARKKRIAECIAVVGDVPTKEIVAAVRKGPIYPEGRFPKPRKRGKKPEALATFGNTVVGYTFEHGGKTYRYAVDVPVGYDSEKATGLLLDPEIGRAHV